MIITGANRGLGKALADQVLVNDDTFLFSISRAINDEHTKYVDRKLFFIKTDLADSFAVNISDIKKHIKKNSVIYFFNNAGLITPIEKVGGFSKDEILKSISVNISFPVIFTNFLISEFKENPIKIINVTSGAANKLIEYWSLYSASKAYMDVFFKTLMKESNFEIYNIDPGVLDTAMQEIIRTKETPSQDYFQSLKKENKLVSPCDAAKEILNKIDF